MNRFIAIILTLCATGTAFGDIITNKAGQVYNVKKIVRSEPDGITVMHDTGLVKLFFWELPEDIQAKYGYDPATASTYNRQSSEAKARAYQQYSQNRKAAVATAEAGEFPARAFNIRITPTSEKYQKNGSVTYYLHSYDAVTASSLENSARKELTGVRTVYEVVFDVNNSRNTDLLINVSFGTATKQIAVSANETLKGITMKSQTNDSAVRLTIDGITKIFSRI